MTDREVEPHSSNSQKELPTILQFHVKQPNHHKINEDAICCSTAPHSFSAFHVKQLGCCRDAVFHVKHSAEKALFPKAMATGKSKMGNLFS